MNKQYGFYFEQGRCISCYACEVGCKQWHDIKANTIKLRQVTETATGSFPDIKRTFFSFACRHCAKPPCATVCPTRAISKNPVNGIVTVDEDNCIGCRDCLEACPFGIPQFDEAGMMRICDMCPDRIEQGKEPICSATCPTGALHFGTVSELSGLASLKAIEKIARGKTDSNEG